MNIGLFGGTFDPPHTGHLIVAQDAAIALGLDQILFVPAAQPPHKLERVMTPPALRARMLDLSIAGNASFQSSALELERRGPSFTVDTLRRLTADHPSTRWTLLIGADQYAEFGSWHEPETIRRLARVAVLTRGGANAGMPGTATGGESQVEQLDRGDVRVHVTRIDISATQIRARVAAGQSIRYLVPAAVATFIFEQGLYNRNGAPVTG